MSLSERRRICQVYPYFEGFVAYTVKIPVRFTFPVGIARAAKSAYELLRTTIRDCALPLIFTVRLTTFPASFSASGAHANFQSAFAISTFFSVMSFPRCDLM